jgi:uncharacterized membrane protein
MRMDLALHIIAGALGLLSGFVALSVAKGSKLHRKVGMVFLVSMITMALMGATIAAVYGVAPFGNIPIALLTTYLVITALITVRPPAVGTRRLDLTLMLVALGIGAALFSFGFAAVASPNGTLRGFPAPPFFIFGAITVLAIVGDARMLRSGGVQAIRGAPRLARHLWRMCTALLIAAFSFFIGQAQVIPKPIRIIPLLIMPPLAVLGAILYWLWRVRVRRTLRGIVVGVRAPEPGISATH